MVTVLNSSHLGENRTVADLKGSRDYALVVLKIHTSHPLEDIAALRLSDLHIQGAMVTIHWWHAHDQQHDEHLSSIVSTALLWYLHVLHGTALATRAPDTPLWVGMQRVSDHMMLSTRSIASIYRKHLGKTQNQNVQPRLIPDSIKNTASQAQQHSTPEDAANASIRTTAATALHIMRQSPDQDLSAIAPSDITLLRQEIIRRKAIESKSATIRDLWRITSGKRFVVACRLYALLLQDAARLD